MSLNKRAVQAERERDSARARVARAEAERDAERKVRVEEYAIAKHLRIQQSAEVADLTAALTKAHAEHSIALASVREECAKVADSFWNREVPGYDRTPRPGDRIADGTAQLIAAAIRALSLPTTEPAKAEEG